MRLSYLRNIWEDVVVSLIFFTIIPISKFRNTESPSNLTRAQWTFPLVGALVGFVTILVASICNYLGLNATASAILGIIAGISLTGFPPEHGLANAIENFQKVAEKKEKIGMMKRNKLGTFGTLGLIILILLKVSLIADLLDSPGCFLSVIAAFSLGRTSIVILRRIAMVASDESYTIFIDKAPFNQTLLAILLGACWLMPVSFILPLIAIAAILILIFGVRLLSNNQIGGITSDVLGASAQIVEIFLLVIFNIWLHNGA